MHDRTIVISGLPASGKSTVGRILSKTLELPLFDKDTFLEETFPDTSVEPEHRQRLSRQADLELRRSVVATPNCIVVSFWRRPEISTSSGTPTDWLQDLASVVEVYCDCDPRLAARRFHQRVRHPGHGDSAKNYDQTLAVFTQLHDLGPLGVGRTVHLNTSDTVDRHHLLGQL